MNRYYTLIISKLSSTEPAYAIPRMGGGEHNQAQIHLNPYSSCEHVYHYPHLVGSFCLHSNPLFPERWAFIFKQSIWIHHKFVSLGFLLELWVSSHPNPILVPILSGVFLQPPPAIPSFKSILWREMNTNEPLDPNSILHSMYNSPICWGQFTSFPLVVWVKVLTFVSTVVSD